MKRYSAVIDKPDVKAVRISTQALLLIVGAPILIPLLVLDLLINFIITPTLDFFNNNFWRLIYWVEGKYIQYKGYNEELEKNNNVRS